MKDGALGAGFGLVQPEILVHRRLEQRPEIVHAAVMLTTLRTRSPSERSCTLLAAR